MKKHKKWLIPVVCVVAVLSILFIAWFNHKPTEIKYPQVITCGGANMSDPREVVGVSDYVVVGYIEEMHDYYTEKHKHDFPALLDYYDMAFTECKLTVVTNIKGNIEGGTEFSYYKTGGINWLRTGIWLDEEGDVYPEVGKYYIFRGAAHPDGTVTGGGLNSTIPLEDGINESNLEESAIYQTYLDAAKNQIKHSDDPYDYLCTADVNYGDGTYNAELYAQYLEHKKEIDSNIDEEYYEAIKDGNPKIE